MRWLLITNNGNPGDIWVRLGVQEIIRRLDKSPTFLIRERDHRKGDPHRGLTEPEGGLEFDYSVICGMPLLWSHREPDGSFSSTVQHESWQALMGWCSAGGRMIVAGFGILLACPNSAHEWFLEEPEILPEIQSLFDKCRLVYARSPLVKKFFPKVNSLHCPSVLALPRGNWEKDLKLANFMPGGGHYPGLAPQASAIMEARMPALAKQLIESGWHFAAHRPAEEDLALRLGWPKDKIFTWRFDGSGANLLSIYGRCAKYLGNRIHGGIMARAAGAEAVVIAYDTRLADVYSMTGYTFTPSQFPEDFSLWIKEPPRSLPYDIEHVRAAHLSWWSTKLRLPIRE